MKNEVFLGLDAKRKMVDGVNILAEAVKVTLGAQGNSVVLQNEWGGQTVTKDGVSVAKAINLSDPLEAIGANLVKEVASKTADVAGDGTTTATVIAQSLINNGMKLVTSGVSPIQLKSGMNQGVEVCAKVVAELSTPCETYEEIKQVATVSANNDSSIGKIIADAVTTVGNDGVITVEGGNSIEDSLTTVDGMEFSSGYVSPYFAKDAEKVVLENPFVLLYNGEIEAVRDIIPVLEKCNAAGKSLLLVANNVEGEALATLVVNNLRGILKSCVVKSPGYGDSRLEQLEDIATVLGATVTGEGTGIALAEVTSEMFGSAKRVEVTTTTTTLIDGAGTSEAIDTRVQTLKDRVEGAVSAYDKEQLEKRVAKLTGGVAVIRVGASTETEMKEKADRVDDALAATRCAIKEGIVPGGGVALLRCVPALNEAVKGATGSVKSGLELIAKAIQSPIKSIIENCGLDSTDLIQDLKSKDKNQGFNALTGEVEDMLAAGIIDPALVTMTALQNAVSIAQLILTTNAAVVNLPESEDQV